MNSADLPAVLTVEEAADVLRIGRSAAYAAVHSGAIPSIKIGRSVRIPRHGLERMLGGIAHNDQTAGKAIGTTT